MTLAPTALAGAVWTAGGSGAAAGAATTMPTGLAPTGAATGSSVALRWPAATMANGTAVTGYVITRINAVNGSASAAGGTCAGVVAATTCTDSPVPAGDWVYTDTPVQLSWTGGQSAPGGPILVS